MMGYILNALENYVFVFPLYLLLEILIYSFYRKKIHIRKLHLAGFQALVCLMVAMMTITGSAGISDIGNYGDKIIRTDEINLIPFVNWGIQDLFGLTMNLFLFVPLGLLIPLLWKKGTTCIGTVKVGFCLSLLIEISQLFNRRATDIDDLIMNTLGTALGYLIYRLFFHRLKVFQLENDAPGILIKNAALISVALIFLCYFFIGDYIVRMIWWKLAGY